MSEITPSLSQRMLAGGLGSEAVHRSVVGKLNRTVELAGESLNIS